jgi:hypothetical protein
MDSPLRVTVHRVHGQDEIDAYPTPVPGLVIHEALGEDGWSLTHVRSGTQIARFADPEAALACAIDLGPLGDWTNPLDWGALRRPAWAIVTRWHMLPPNPAGAMSPETGRKTGAIL